MNKVVLSAAIFCLSAVVCFSQTSKMPVPSGNLKPARIQPTAEISDTEWRILIDAVQAENWEESRFVAGQYLTKLGLTQLNRYLIKIKNESAKSN